MHPKPSRTERECLQAVNRFHSPSEVTSTESPLTLTAVLYSMAYTGMGKFAANLGARVYEASDGLCGSLAGSKAKLVKSCSIGSNEDHGALTGTNTLPAHKYSHAKTRSSERQLTPIEAGVWMIVLPIEPEVFEKL